MIHVCKYCKKEFGGRKEKIFCSNECSIKGHIKEREERYCKTCGKEFEIVIGNKHVINKKYCSLKCFYDDQKRGKEIICPICGEIFYRKLANIKNRKTLACSVSCSVQLTMNQKGKSSQEKLTQLLEKYFNEKAKREVAFDDLKNIRNLRVDMVFENNKVAVEFNGKQHYFNDGTFQYNVDLDEGVKIDNKKIKYLFNHGYTIIEWPYYTSISELNAKSVVKQIANQQRSLPIYLIVGKNVQRLTDEVIEPISPTRVPDILKIRKELLQDDDIVRSCVFWIEPQKMDKQPSK